MWLAPFISCVQFHPELMIYRKRFRNLFFELVRCAASRARERLAEAVDPHTPLVATSPPKALPSN